MIPAMQEFDDISSLCALIDATPTTVYLRYSKGPAADSRQGFSRDYESGLLLPGLSVTTLNPEPWWTLPREYWVARRIRKYGELERDPERFAWALTGTISGRGPDHEPLVKDVHPLGRLTDSAVDEADRLYRAHFDVGRDSVSSEAASG